MVDRLGTNPLRILVHNNDYTQARPVGHYISCRFSEEFGFTAGTGQLVVEADHPLAGRLMQADMDVVPVTASYNGWQWTGRVRDYVATGTPGRETLTCELVSDELQLSSVLAFSSPKSSLSLQKKRDYQRGPLLQVVHHYLATNLGRADLPVYLFMPPSAKNDTSPQIDVSARMTYLDQLLKDALDQHDYNLVARMWWPGQPFPVGKMVPLSVAGQEIISGVLSEMGNADPDSEGDGEAGGGETAQAVSNFVRLRRGEADNAMNEGAPGLFSPTTAGLMVWVEPVREREHVRFSTASGEVEAITLSGKASGPVRAVVGGKSDEWVNDVINIGIDTAVQGLTTAVAGGVTGALAGGAAGATLGSAAGPLGTAVGAAAGLLVGSLARSATEDTVFAFTDRVDVQRKATEGPFHLRESFTSSSAGVFTYDTSALAERALLDAQGGQAISFTMVDGRSKILGDDTWADNGKPVHGYRVGDRVQLHEHLSGRSVTDIVTGVEVTDEVGARLRVTPRVGKQRNTSNPFLDMVDGMNRAFGTLRDLGLSA